MPLPTYVASGTFTAAAGAIIPPFPAETQADDIALLVCESENEAISLSVPEGFVEVTNSPQFAGTAATNPANRIAVFWKRLVGGDMAPTMADSGNHNTAQIHVFRGVKTSGNPWNITAGGNDGGVNDTSGVIPGATTTVADCLIVLVCGSSFNGTSTAQFSAYTNADLANILERTDNTNTAGLGGGHGMATGEKAAAGTYGNTTVTLANTSFKGALSIALEPPGAANYTDQPATLFIVIPSAVNLGAFLDAPSLIEKIDPAAAALAARLEFPALDIKFATAAQDVSALIDAGILSVKVVFTEADLLAAVDIPGTVVKIVPSVTDTQPQNYSDMPALILKIIPSVSAVRAFLDVGETFIKFLPSALDILSAIVSGTMSVKFVPAAIDSFAGFDVPVSVVRLVPASQAALAALDAGLLTAKIIPAATSFLAAVDADNLSLRLIPEDLNLLAAISSGALIIKIIPAVDEVVQTYNGSAQAYTDQPNLAFRIVPVSPVEAILGNVETAQIVARIIALAVDALSSTNRQTSTAYGKIATARKSNPVIIITPVVRSHKRRP